MRIRVHTDVERFTRDLDDVARRQVPFALARALTWTAKDAQGDVQAELPKRFTIRRPFVPNSVRITPATKTKPEAIVGVGSRAGFMLRQETGGTKRASGGHRVAVPKSKPQRVIPKGQRPQAVRDKPRVFLIKTKYGTGIVRRDGKARYPLTFLYWLKPAVRVKPVFGFKVTTSTTVQDRFGVNFVESLSRALGSKS